MVPLTLILTIASLLVSLTLVHFSPLVTLSHGYRCHLSQNQTHHHLHTNINFIGSILLAGLSVSSVMAFKALQNMTSAQIPHFISHWTPYPDHHHSNSMLLTHGTCNSFLWPLIYSFLKPVVPKPFQVLAHIENDNAHGGGCLWPGRLLMAWALSTLPLANSRAEGVITSCRPIVHSCHTHWEALLWASSLPWNELMLLYRELYSGRITIKNSPTHIIISLILGILWLK